jgi:saccharopine dehydrogenase-like NADP-dependent oxidoreductase
MNSPTYLIVGCGYFGSRAAEKLLRKDPKPKITVVDRNEEAVKKVSVLSKLGLSPQNRKERQEVIFFIWR